MEHCAECGFAYDLASPHAAESISEGAAEFAAMLTASTARPHIRRVPTVWSLLEYGCHLRDMLLVQRERVLAARRRQHVLCEPMGRDERVEHDGYGQQDPADVARQLTMAAHLLANVLARLAPGDWDRTVVYTYPHRTERSLRWVAAHTVHEVRHHLLDGRRQLSMDPAG